MRLRTLLYSLALLPAMLPMAVKAQSGACGVSVTWQLSDSTLTISGEGDMYDNVGAYSYAIYSEKVSKVVINDGVTSIGSGAFKDFPNLKSVDLGSTVTLIKSNSFENTKLNSVAIPASVISLGANCFTNTKISKIEIPSNVKEVGYGVFDRNQNLREVYWDAAMTYEESCSYGFNPIFDRDYITTITFGPNAKYIPSGLMSGVETKYDIKSSGNIEYIGLGAFVGSKWMDENLDEPVLYFDKCLCSYGNGFNTPTDVVVKDGTVGITAEAFINNRYLVGITIPETVEVIGDNAFSGCSSLGKISWNAIDCKAGLYYNIGLNSNLSEISFGDKVVNIPDGLCSNCKGLTSLVFPESVRTIGSNAFNGCTGIESIQFNANLDSISDYAFSDCVKLKAAHLTARKINYSAFNNCSNVSEITFSDNVRVIDWGNFPSAKIESLTIPASMERIEGLMPNGHVSNVYIECEDAASVLSYAFSGYNQVVNNMEFAEGVKTCQYVNVVDTIIIPESVVKLNGGSCNTLFYNAVVAEGSINCNCVTIGDNVQLIPDNFVGGSSIKEVVLPSSVNEIGYGAFAYCQNLENVTALWYNPREVNVEYDVFRGINSNATLYVPKGRVEAYRELYPWSEFAYIKEIDGSTEIGEVEAPSITYENGELKFYSSTQNVEYHYTISDPDIVVDQTSYGSVWLNAYYEISVYASARGLIDSKVTKAKLYFIEANLEGAGLIDAAVKRGVLVSTSGASLTISGLDYGESVEVYDTMGRLVARGNAADGICTLTVDTDQSVVLVHTATETIKVRR